MKGFALCSQKLFLQRYKNVSWRSFLQHLFQPGKKTIVLIIVADLPSAVMVLVGIVVHLGARQWVNWGRRQRNVGPVGAVGFARFGSSLGLLLLPSLPTCTREEEEEVERMRLRDTAAANQIVEQKSIINQCARGMARQNYGSCFCHVTNGLFSRTQFEANVRQPIHLDLGSNVSLEKHTSFQTAFQWRGLVPVGARAEKLKAAR